MRQARATRSLKRELVAAASTVISNLKLLVKLLRKMEIDCTAKSHLTHSFDPNKFSFIFVLSWLTNIFHCFLLYPVMEKFC
jgi:hypothetical protein